VAVVGAPGPDPALDGAVLRVLRAQLAELQPDAALESSPLDWGDLQLAAGCMGADDECFAAVAAQLEVAEIVLSSLSRADAASTEEAGWTLELLRFHSDGVAREVVVYAGERARRELLRRVPNAARALYGLSPEALPPPLELEGDDGGISAGPYLLAGGALALGAVGAAFAVAASGSADEWTEHAIETPQDVDQALAARDRAEQEAIAADALIVGASVALGVAVVWWIVEVASSSATSDAEARRSAPGTWRW